MTKKQNEVLQFLLKYKTATENQLIKLTECSIQDINYLLTNKLILKDKTTNLIYHKLRGLDVKYMVALDVICKYQSNIQSYTKAKFPVILSFYIENISYDIIVAKKIEQKRIFEMLDEISLADRIIIIIENTNEYDLLDINTNRECLICSYPLKVIGKVN